MLSGVAAIWVALALLVPSHVRVFFQRLALGSQHYPSRTQLLAVTVNGKRVDLTERDDAEQKVPVHVPFGQTVHFEVVATGVQPAAGRVELSQNTRVAAVNVPLELVQSPAASPAVYRGGYPGLNQSTRYQVYLGDAWTDPLFLSVTPLPLIEIEGEVVPPALARQTPSDIRKLPRGMRQFSVLAGSEVRLRLESDRPLKSAEITIAGKVYSMGRQTGSSNPAENPLEPASSPAPSGGPEVWTLPSAGTPLGSVAADLAFSIQIRDPEGQTLDQPLEGSITIEPDQPPAVLATTRTPIVLPTGSPSIHYEAADDHALSSIWITWEATQRQPPQGLPVR